MMRETTLDAGDLIYPLFVTHGHGVQTPIQSMPGVFQWSPDVVGAEAKAAADLGVPAVLLFGLPAHKDPVGSENFAADGVVPQAIAAIKAAAPELVIITDVCMCEYTDHGHCGLVNSGDRPHLPPGYVLNDESLEIIAKVAVTHAQAGADIVAPSGMLDGQVGALRAALDGAGYEHVPVLAYSTKYASALYGPFREAAQGAPQFGDRKTHQMDPANAREALRETALDVAEGADMLMVKPALAYLDIVRQVRDAYPGLPLVAYNVSGEYAMVKAAAANGWIDEQRAALEILTSMKRAGADLIITYYAKEAAAWLAAAVATDGASRKRTQHLAGWAGV
jgi:porphobilinogen synthase